MSFKVTNGYQVTVQPLIIIFSVITLFLGCGSFGLSPAVVNSEQRTGASKSAQTLHPSSTLRSSPFLPLETSKTWREPLISVLSGDSQAMSYIGQQMAIVSSGFVFMVVSADGYAATDCVCGVCNIELLVGGLEHV